MKVYNTEFGLSSNKPIYVSDWLTLEIKNAMAAHLNDGAKPVFLICSFLDDMHVRGNVIGLYPGATEEVLQDALKNTVMSFVEKELGSV